MGWDTGGWRSPSQQQDVDREGLRSLFASCFTPSAPVRLAGSKSPAVLSQAELSG